jgi:predicted component of type VI protein secretion system
VRSISAAILEYEPRLGNVTVRQLPAEGLFLRFEIAGSWRGRAPAGPLRGEVQAGRKRGGGHLEWRWRCGVEVTT